MSRRATQTGSHLDRHTADVARRQALPVVLRRGDGSELCLLGERCAVMGILNLTPDSFSDGGRYDDAGRGLARGLELIAAGADILDLGAESTRPGARPLDAAEEWRRLAPVLEPLGKRGLPVVLSVDTRHAEVAERAAAVGARLLNLPFPQDLPRQVPDPRRRLELLRAFDACVVMHSRGDPTTMRDQTAYGEDLCQTVVDELHRTVAALFMAGDSPRSRSVPVAMAKVLPVLPVLFDPGLGFAKTTEQSLALLGRLPWLRRALGGRLLIGASRKSMLGAITGLPTAERLIPSVVAAALAAYHGADVVRVHDVAGTLQALRVAEALRKAGGAA